MSGKRIFITGGASGLGKAIALRYARAGWRVCIGDVHEARGQETLTELQALGPSALSLRCDVTREEDLRAVAERLTKDWGGVDVVVNNAGVAQAGAIAGTSDDAPADTTVSTPASSTYTSPSTTDTAWVRTAFFAGGPDGRPVRRSKHAACSGHSTAQPSSQPSDSDASWCVQVSSIA